MGLGLKVWLELGPEAWSRIMDLGQRKSSDSVVFHSVGQVYPREGKFIKAFCIVKVDANYLNSHETGVLRAKVWVYWSKRTQQV